MTARFAIKGVRKSYSHALFHTCGGCSALGTYIKLRKNPGNYKRREKIGAKIRRFMPDFESR